MLPAAHRVWLLTVLTSCVFGISASVSAQTPETVFFTGPDNNISRAVSFGTCSVPGEIAGVIQDGGTNFKGIVVRGDLCLIAANSTQGGGLRMYDPGAATPAARILGPFASFDSVVAVDVDTSENLFAVNDDPGGPDQLVFVPRNPTPGCTRQGYDPALVLDGQVDGAFVLADVKFVRFAPSGAAYGGGDVLVLVRDAPALLRYRAGVISTTIAAKRANLGAPDAAPEATPVISSFAGQTPTGFAFAGNGDILVVTLEGSIQRFSPAGILLSSSFDPLPGGGGANAIAVGTQASDRKVFVTERQGNGVVMFDEDTGACEGRVVTNSPHGVGNASLNAKGLVATPQSVTPVTVVPDSSHQITFAKVDVAGATSANIFLFPDPDPYSGLDRTVDFSAFMSGLPQRTIPGHVKAFMRTGAPCPGDGMCPTFMLSVADSTTASFGATQQHHIEENSIGFNTSCYSGDPSAQAPDLEQPRTFYATDANDPAIVEAAAFTDISTGCGSNIGRGSGFSLFLVGWDSRAVATIASEKLTNLKAALNGNDASQGGLAPFIQKGKARNTLNGLLDQAIAAYQSSQISQALGHLQSFIDAVNPADFRQCPKGKGQCRDAPGELVARALSAKFMVCGASASCQELLQ